ncbi:MAG: gliding motility protein GldM [Flavobacteriaceae bacterium]|mgnify:FL=1|nr:gliding motility protein GldM [Flavobacteriaceae bacterium]MDC1401622.1 gliding motility protein GldM [Flavobacteriaceae bacterium]
MAGANETPRNKLIALMYLVFITMLALNVSKEVLDGFGQMFKKIQSANERVNQGNIIYYDKIEVNAQEKEGKWVGHDRTAKEIRKESDKFFARIAEIKAKITEKQRIADPELKEYSQMDKGEALDLIFFDASGLSPEGEAFVDMINAYKMRVIQVFASQFPQYTDLVEERFFTGDFEGNVPTSDGSQPWLANNFEGFPLISSLAKLTMMQNDIRLTESDVLNALLGKELEGSSKVNTDNYITLLKSEKGAYYQGETFDGSVILGRKGGAQNPNEVSLTMDGRKLSENEYEKIPGGVKLKVSAGRPGDHRIEGDLVFLNAGMESRIPVDQSFAVISKPNAAVISADKMNVVYRGVDNPMTISIPGIPDDKIRATAPGLKRSKGSKFIMNPGKGREITIAANGTLPDGMSVSTKTKFRIKDLPRPNATFFRQSGKIRLPKASIERAEVGAILEDFDFDLTLKTLEFKVKVPGAPTITCRGTKLNAKALQALGRVRSGQEISIFDLKVQNPSKPNYKFKRVAPVLIEIL